MKSELKIVFFIMLILALGGIVFAASIVRNSPANLFETTSNTVVFNITVNTSDAISETYIYVNGSSNVTQFCTDEVSCIFTTTLPQGYHQWFVNYSDNALNATVIGTESVPFDTTPKNATTTGISYAPFNTMPENATLTGNMTTTFNTLPKNATLTGNMTAPFNTTGHTLLNISYFTDVNEFCIVTFTSSATLGITEALANITSKCNLTATNSGSAIKLTTQTSGTNTFVNFTGGSAEHRVGLFGIDTGEDNNDVEISYYTDVNEACSVVFTESATLGITTALANITSKCNLTATNSNGAIKLTTQTAGTATFINVTSGTGRDNVGLFGTDNGEDNNDITIRYTNGSAESCSVVFTQSATLGITAALANITSKCNLTAENSSNAIKLTTNDKGKNSYINVSSGTGRSEIGLAGKVSGSSGDVFGLKYTNNLTAESCIVTLTQSSALGISAVISNITSKCNISVYNSSNKVELMTYVEGDNQYINTTNGSALSVLGFTANDYLVGSEDYYRTDYRYLEVRDSSNWSNFRFGNETNDVMFLNSAKGFLGIGTNSPSYPIEIATNGTSSNVSIWVSGVISAAGLVDRTPFPDKDYDALSEIREIKSDGNGQIDHNSLPSRVQKTIDKPIYATNSNQVLKVESYEGRDVGGMVSVNTVALQQTLERLESMESLLCKQYDHEEFCINYASPLDKILTFVEEVFTGDPKYTCSVTFETRECARISGTGLTCYPHMDDDKGRIYCKTDTLLKGEWEAI